MKFLFVPYPEGGHLAPAVSIAEALVARGHRVTFASLIDVQPVLAAYPFVPLFPEIFPAGSLVQFAPGRPWRRRFWHITQLRRTLEAVERGAFRDTLRELRPDLVVLDPLFFFLSLPAFQSGIKAVALHVTLPWDTSYTVPPLTSGLDHVRSRGFAVRRAVVELRSRCQDAYERYLDVTGWTLNIKGRVGKMAAVLAPGVRTTQRGHAIHMVLDLPEIVLCPRAFDLPGRERINRRYVGPSLRERRDPQDFPWHRLVEDQPVVYCALGSRVPPYAHAERLFESVVRAARRREMQAVIATGACPTTREWYDAPQVTAVPNAPQRALLERASIFVTHAGLGSVKEAAMAGVPMIAFPMLADQPGNAARIARHKIGLVGSARSATPESIGALIDTVVTDPEIAAATRRMRDLFVREERTNAAWHVLERLAATGRADERVAVAARARGGAA
jgi:MGT family glycosyltransferase